MDQREQIAEKKESIPNKKAQSLKVYVKRVLKCGLYAGQDLPITLDDDGWWDKPPSFAKGNF